MMGADELKLMMMLMRGGMVTRWSQRKMMVVR